ncbi:MAG: putative heme-binding domain-containing protein [Verrucomicrobiales bacterium]|jgi:putative heme-binding domain-containing protein
MKVILESLLAVLLLPLVCAIAQETAWEKTQVPGDLTNAGTAGNGEGFVWFRALVHVPAEWVGSRLLLIAGEIDGVDEAFFNGRKVGANGSMPPLFNSPASSVRRPFVIEPDWIRFGSDNYIAWRIFSPTGTAGIVSGPVHLSRKENAIDLQGTWQCRAGDSADWSQWESDAADTQLSPPSLDSRVIAADLVHREKMIASVYKKFEDNSNPFARNDDKGDALSAEAARETMIVGDGLVVETVLNEPVVTQPLYVDFDERGRMWVVQYIQYPDPAGLEVLTWDNHLRKVFDQVPPPPPFDTPEKASFAGRDRITIHEDTNNDGTFDLSKVFLDGLNLATSVARGRGGVWVMQPPYLLFYPDANGDDVPDTDPIVHLSGFGLEDTHSIANSLKWGPDGWLYGGVGSTVTARVRAHLSGSDQRHSFFGQNIWRYHPETHVFELFAEGGWNTFGVDFDDKGRVYSGTNGSQQAVHFVQGGYYQKSFGKHGPHTNPHTFGHFYGMPIKGEKIRMVHQWIYYNSGAIPTLEGLLIGGNALASKLHALKMNVVGSTFETVEQPNPLRTDHKWFRPVHCTVGPDGAIYISDFYDARITHVDPRDNWDRERGRIYRLRAAAKPEGEISIQDFSGLTSAQWVQQLRSRNQWARRTAQRLLADSKDKSVLPLLLEQLKNGNGNHALEALWAINGIGEFSDAVALEGMKHSDAHVRAWAVRLCGDSRATLLEDVFKLFLNLAELDEAAVVVSQLAATAARLPSPQALAVVRKLSMRDAFVDDPFISQQLWWALEEQMKRDPLRCLALFDESEFWNNRMVIETLAERIGRRFMSERTPENLARCATLLHQSIDREEVSEALARGMALALDGTSLSTVPAALDEALADTWRRYPDSAAMVDLALRLRTEKALSVARSRVSEATEATEATEAIADKDLKIRFIKTLSEMGDELLVPELLKIVITPSNADDLVLAALNGLRRFSDDEIPSVLLDRYGDLPVMIQKTIQSILASRSDWSHQLLQAVDRGSIKPESVMFDTLLVLQSRGDEEANTLIAKHWSGLRQPAKAKAQRMDEIRKVLTEGDGAAARGRQLFAVSCGICHQLGEVGKNIAPDLTGYERGNLDFLLPAIVDPNLGVREEFEWVTVTLRAREGATAAMLSGFVSEATKQTITLKDLVGNEIVVSRRDIADQSRSPVSVMPEGLLDALNPQQIRDLFAFIQKK